MCTGWMIRRYLVFIVIGFTTRQCLSIICSPLARIVIERCFTAIVVLDSLGKDESTDWILVDLVLACDRKEMGC